MNWAWATSLDHIWRSPAFPMWLTLAAAGFFGILVLITLLRAEKSVANGALTVITLLAVGIAVAATIRGFGPPGRNMPGEGRSQPRMSAGQPAMSCADDLAGDAVVSACEKVLFGSAESVAAAVSFTASELDRLIALGDVATAERTKTPELQALRRTLERDRFGMVAQVLVARDHCSPTECAAFRSLTDSRQILVNIDNHLYDLLVARYAPSWNAPPPAPVPVAALGALGPSVPTGRPTNADFPSSSSIPPVSIMTAEPGTGTKSAGEQKPSAPAANAQAATPRPPAQDPAKPPPAAVKKQAAQKQPPKPPTPISPAPTAPPPGTATND
jgi:hypothetical protein